MPPSSRKAETENAHSCHRLPPSLHSVPQVSPLPSRPGPIKIQGEMPLPAADLPSPEKAFSVTALKWHTCAWLLLPVLIFMAGWMHWYIALPLALLLTAGLALPGRKASPEKPALPAFPLFTRSSFLVLAAFIVLMVLSGWGEWVNQHPDHIVRNACLSELVTSSWPVVFPDGDVLIYNTGFWLVPALAGKLAGLNAARVLLVLWGAWGLFLSWLWLCVFSGRRSLVLALLMVMFGSMLNFQCGLGLDTLRLHYFGTAEQVMCSANASIPVMLFFLFLVSGRMPMNWIPLLFAAMAFYSPLAALGGLSLAFCQWVLQWKDSRASWRNLLHPSFLSAVILGVCFLLYYAAVNAPSSQMGIRGFYTCLGDFLLVGTSFLLYALFCWRDFRRNPLFICTLATGLVLPFFYINGDANDLLCKGCVPVMACMLAFLAATWVRHPGLRIWIGLLLVLGLAPLLNIPYYCCSSTSLQAWLAPSSSDAEPPSLLRRKWLRLTYAPRACRQDEWEQTMHHPGHRWYPYYSGTPRSWLRFIYRF